MTNYFRITAYNPATDVSAILDSNGRFEKLWQFSSFLVRKGYNPHYLNPAGHFDEGNLPCVSEPSDKIIVRACMNGRMNNDNGKITVNGKYYFPEEKLAYVRDVDLSQDFDRIWFLDTEMEWDFVPDQIIPYNLQIEYVGHFGIEDNEFDLYMVTKGVPAE